LARLLSAVVLFARLRLLRLRAHGPVPLRHWFPVTSSVGTSPRLLCDWLALHQPRQSFSVGDVCGCVLTPSACIPWCVVAAMTPRLLVAPLPGVHVPVRAGARVLGEVAA